ncbi:MAG: glycogen/starch/alpha-glucan phosphorylase [Deltaproteobacteria bacterium]|nr:glycogen/starch/alpha-glucan phosphorylase [Deltaproteobacteria bacterium]
MVEQNYASDDVEELKRDIARHMEYSQAKTRHTAQTLDWYKSLALAVRDRVMERWNDTQEAYYRNDAKRVYYLSMEFLLGRTMHNALLNLDLLEPARKAMQDFGMDLDELIVEEPDAGLGNGGLGRLAACFVDSMATMQLPATGYGIRYDYGIFEQAIVDGFQVERPDDWLRQGNTWEILRPEYTYRVQFGGRVEQSTDAEGRLRNRWVDTDDVLALPYDLPVPGYRNRTVNSLRLWSARALNRFDLKEFNKGEYIQAMEDRVLGENISKVLYPKDDIPPGKILRLKQEYFFVSATIQDIIRRYRVNHDDFEAFPDKVAIQLNDTHPALAIPELMRLWMDEEGMDWDKAWALSVKTFAYTNHTILPEALEHWPVRILHDMLPRHLQIIYEINRRFLEQVAASHPDDERLLRRMSIVEEQPVKSVRMAHLAIVGSHSVNGVAALHTEIIKAQLFGDFHGMWPERFNNKTNGVTQRRWLKLCNPQLSKLIDRRIGPDWVTDLGKLKGLADLADEAKLQKRWLKVKREKKAELAKLVLDQLGIELDLDSIFDVQIKRIHEYKRQLMNIMHVVALYHRIKDDPKADFAPRSFIFAGKAAPGYAMAKRVIKLIHAVADVVNNDEDVAGRLKVVFLPNYSVSMAQKLFPAADVSEQISTAGYEASGTGNMKFQLNGAITLGTLDGANVEILEEVGQANIFIFGLKAHEVAELRQQGYHPQEHYDREPELKRVVDAIAHGDFSPDEPGRFKPILDSLLTAGDTYMVMADFAAYAEAHEQMVVAYGDRKRWARMSILNTAFGGKFSSDRTIGQYASEIWDVKAVAPLHKKDR